MSNRDPKKPFYLTASIDNADGTFDISGHSVLTDHDDEIEARAKLFKEAHDSSPLPHVAFLCIPIMINERRPMKIINIKNGIVPTTRQKRKARKS